METVRSADGVPIAFTSRGEGTPALVFVHGGLAHRGFWRHQVADLSSTFHVVTLDLAGHGESGRARTAWTMALFGADVRAVVERLRLERVVLFGNSLGGPVALEAAHLLPGRVLGVVGVDTFHRLDVAPDETGARARAEAFQTDPVGMCRAMVKQLFHPGQHAALQAWAESEMCAVPPAVIVGIMDGLAGYDVRAAVARARDAGVAIRAINGDLWPTATEANRAAVPGFDAFVIPNAGHYPMLEQPEAFNGLVERVVDSLAGAGSAR